MDGTASESRVPATLHTVAAAQFERRIVRDGHLMFVELWLSELAAVEEAEKYRAVLLDVQ